MGRLAKPGKIEQRYSRIGILSRRQVSTTGLRSLNTPEKLAAALRDEDLNEWRNLVSDAKPFLEEATHLASRLGAKGSSVFRIIGLAFLAVQP
jgi:hypothetical protein